VGHYLRVQHAALGRPDVRIGPRQVEQFMKSWSIESQAVCRFGNKMLGLGEEGLERSTHGDEVYIADQAQRGAAAREYTKKTIQNSINGLSNIGVSGFTIEAGETKESVSQAAVDMSTIAFATQDVADLRKMKRQQGLFGGKSLIAPISLVTTTTIPVDNTLPIHEVEMQASGVIPQVAELANYTELVAPQTREWSDQAVLYGAFQTISEEAKKADRAGVLAELPDSMAEMMMWVEFLAVWSPFLNNSNISDGSAVFNAVEGNINTNAYTHSVYVDTLVQGIQRTDWSVDSGVNARHTAFVPVAAVGSPALWAQLTRDTSEASRPGTPDRDANVVYYGFGGITNHAMPHFASAGITDRLFIIGDGSMGEIGTMLRYEGRTSPEVFIADSRSAGAGPGWLSNAYQIKVRYGFRFYIKSRKNIVAIVP